MTVFLTLTGVLILVGGVVMGIMTGVSASLPSIMYGFGLATMLLSPPRG